MTLQQRTIEAVNNIERVKWRLDLCLFFYSISKFKRKFIASYAALKSPIE